MLYQGGGANCPQNASSASGRVGPAPGAASPTGGMVTCTGSWALRRCMALPPQGTTEWGRALSTRGHLSPLRIPELQRRKGRRWKGMDWYKDSHMVPGKGDITSSRTQPCLTLITREEEAIPFSVLSQWPSQPQGENLISH